MTTQEKPPAPIVEEDLPLYEVQRADSPIIIDGRINEAAWQRAQPIEFIFPWDFQTGAKQKTLARVLWDDECLYVGYECEDADIVAQYTERDDPTYKDDCVEIFITPNLQFPYYYGLEMNARATLFDYFYVYPHVNLRRFNLSGVRLATHIDGTLNMSGDTDKGWSLEVAIPWHNFVELAQTVDPPQPGDIWRAQLNRWDGVEPNRRLSQWHWSGHEKSNPHNPARFGRLKFVK